MKKYFLLSTFLFFCTLHVFAISEVVKIQGDHGLLDAIIQKPMTTNEQKIPMVIICHGFMGNNTPIEYEYKENEEVLFELRKTINPKTGLPFSFAQNVRPIKNPLDNNINR